MFVHDFVQIDAPALVARNCIAGRGSLWFTQRAENAATLSEELYFSIGPTASVLPVRKKTKITLEHPFPRGEAIVYPMHWQATGMPWLFPQLQADLELAPLGETQSQLSLYGQYDPPLGKLGRAADAALLHHIAESSVRWFLQSIAREIHESAKAHRDTGMDRSLPDAIPPQHPSSF